MSSNRYRREEYERIVHGIPVIGGNISILNEYSKAILETKVFKKKVKIMRDHRNWIKHICEFLEANYNEYFTLGTRELSEEELQDSSEYWWKNKCDLICKGFNMKILKVFLGAKGIKENGKIECYSVIRKYFDVILRGLKE